MDSRHRTALTKNRVLLVNNMIVDKEFLSHLQEAHILHDNHVDEILTKPTKAAKAGEFLSILQRRGPKAMEVFITALLKTQQNRIADQVEPGLAARARQILGKSEIAQESRGPNHTEPEPNFFEEDNNALIDIKVRKVDPSNSDFIRKLNDSNVYDVKCRMRGRAVIINNEIFQNERKNREGSKFDMVNLSCLLQGLGYTTVVHNDKTAREMLDIIVMESRHADHQNADSFILAVFSHGADGEIFNGYGRQVFGTDFKPVNIKKVMKAAFDEKNCPALAGKPKLFIIETSQGKDSTEGVQMADTSEDLSSDELSLHSAIERLNTGNGVQHDAVPCQVGPAWGAQNDMLVAYSTAAGTKSWLLPDKGSLFIRTLVKVFMYYAKTHDVLSLLTKVRYVVGHERTNLAVGGFEAQLSVDHITLLKTWYLFPGFTPQ